MSATVNRVMEVLGESTESWEDATRRAVASAAASVPAVSVGNVLREEVTIEDGHIGCYRVRLLVAPSEAGLRFGPTQRRR